MNRNNLVRRLGGLCFTVGLAVAPLAAQGAPPTQEQAAALRSALASNQRKLTPVEESLRNDAILIRDSLDVASASAARILSGVRGGMLSVARSGTRELRTTCAAAARTGVVITPRVEALSIVARDRTKQGSVDKTLRNYQDGVRGIITTMNTCEQTAAALLARTNVTSSEYEAMANKVVNDLVRYEQVTRATLLQFGIPLLPFPVSK